MEINLLEHSTYDVEKIRSNKNFFANLYNKLSETYKFFRIEDWTESNVRHICIAPNQNRVQNVFIKIDLNGEIRMILRGDIAKLSTLKGKYFEESLRATLTIEGITADNFQQYLPSIVKGIEACDYSFK